MRKELLLEKAKPYMAVVLFQFGYAGSALIAKSALNHGMSHYTFSVYRNLIAAVFFVPFAFFFERNIRPKMTLSVMGKIMLLALLDPVIDQNLYYGAMKYTTATYAIAMTNMLPAITFVLAWMLKLEEVSIRKVASQVKILGTILTAGGVMIMTLVTGGGTISFPWTRDDDDHAASVAPPPPHVHPIEGALMIIAGCFCYAIFYNLQAITLKSYPAALSLTSMICMAGAVQDTLLTIVAERHHPIVWSIGWNRILLAYVYSGIVHSGVGYYISGSIMKKKGPVFVTSFNPLGMVIVAILSSFLLHEKLTYGRTAGCRIFGALVIVMGLYLVLLGKSRDEQVSSSSGSANSNSDQIAPADKKTIGHTFCHKNNLIKDKDIAGGHTITVSK